jgi:radical SAM protein with 4Fe4S-binding SPASM domain
MFARLGRVSTKISTVTPARLYHAAGLFASFWRARLTGHSDLRFLPVSVGIEPTTSCNLRCPQCPSGLRSFTRPTGRIDPGFFREIIDQLHPHVGYLTFYFQGEPYLHPDFLKMTRYAADRKIYTVTSTNAHYLTAENASATVGSGLCELIISMDGTTQQSYEKYRIGGDLEHVLEGTRRLVGEKRKSKSLWPRVILQFVVFRHNEREIDTVKELALTLGVDEVRFKSAQVYDFENGSDLIPEAGGYARYTKGREGTWQIKNPYLNHCWKMWHSCVITWDGRVVPCCFDKDASHVMGDLNQESFRDIWFGERYRAFRASLFRSRAGINICRNCTEGLKVS